MKISNLPPKCTKAFPKLGNHECIQKLQCPWNNREVVVNYDLSRKAICLFSYKSNSFENVESQAKIQLLTMRWSKSEKLWNLVSISTHFPVVRSSVNFVKVSSQSKTCSLHERQVSLYATFLPKNTKLQPFFSNFVNSLSLLLISYIPAKNHYLHPLALTFGRILTHATTAASSLKDSSSQGVINGIICFYS